MATVSVWGYPETANDTQKAIATLIEVISRPPPRIVLVTYAEFHDERNTFSRSRRKTLVPWNELGPLEQLAARIDAENRPSIYKTSMDYMEIRCLPC